MKGGLSDKDKRTVREIVAELKKLDGQTLFSYWISAELDEAEIYNALAKRTREYIWDQRIPALFEKLARESAEHAEILLREYKKRYKNEGLVKTNVPSIEIELSLDDLVEYIKKGRLDDLIEILMESERIAKDLYTYLAGETSGDTKELFEHLARIEEGHYEKLKELRDSLEGT
ncbi:ferritin family protein [Thermococcus sp.]|uniref:ferritin-like domain-containing protein n=1 Tax=Thermococcus sp. TaxID=35749 RepID=UPI0026181E57|nr:ferritin family protein [Thermococcus sp.]